MKIIGAGLSKTGTKSLNAALTTLGYRVFDYFEHTELLRQEWEKLVYGEASLGILKEMYKGADAAVAYPASSFWEEFLQVFPDAKVILTIRDNEEQFWESFVDQIQKNDTNSAIFELFSPTYRAWNRFRRAGALNTFYVSPNSKTVPDLNRMLVAQAYRRHNAYVKERCPRDKLLVFNCKEGWKPLCEFLGVPVPDEPFPHKNIKGEFAKHLSKSETLHRVQREVIFSISSLFLAGVIVSSLCFKYMIR